MNINELKSLNERERIEFFVSVKFNDFVKTIIPLLGTDVTTSQANIVKILLPRYVVATMLDLKLEAKENKVKRLVK